MKYLYDIKGEKKSTSIYNIIKNKPNYDIK